MDLLSVEGEVFGKYSYQAVSVSVELMDLVLVRLQLNQEYIIKELKVNIK